MQHSEAIHVVERLWEKRKVKHVGLAHVAVAQGARAENAESTARERSTAMCSLARLAVRAA